MALYSRRVSFNNLYPTYIDPSNPLHVPPQFRDEQKTDDAQATKQPRFYDLNYGFGGASINNIEQYYSDSRVKSSVSAKRKIPKLPPPPSRSILKKKKHNDEINYTITKNYAADHEFDDDDNDNVAGDDADDNDDAEAIASPPQEPAKPRRKSFADMTDEELLALEHSYTKRSSLNIESFNFTNIPSTYIKPPPEPKSKEDKNSNDTTSSSAGFTGGPAPHTDRHYPSRPVVEHGACSMSAKHRNYDHAFPDERDCRVLFCSITGRKHTWNAIDYMVQDLAVDSDHLVITSHISVKEIENLTSRRINAEKNASEGDQKRKTGKGNSTDEADIPQFESSRSYNISSVVVIDKCQKILNYVLGLLDKRQLNVRVSVEIINCNSSKQVFQDAMKLYRPHLVIVGSKTDNGAASTGSMANVHRVMSAVSTSSTSSSSGNIDHRLQQPQAIRRLSGTVSALGRGYNGFYRISGKRCMKLTSYIIGKSPVPVIVVTDNYALRGSPSIDFNDPFNNPDGSEEMSVVDNETADMSTFANKLCAVTDVSRQKSIQEIIYQQQQQQQKATLSPQSSSPTTIQAYQPHTPPKVTFGDDLDFGQGHSMYKVKSLLEPMEQMSMSRTTTRSLNSLATSANHNGKKSSSSSSSQLASQGGKKTQRSKSEGSSDEGNSAGSGKFSLSLKKFGFGGNAKKK